MTKFYKFPDEATYQANQQDAVPVVVLGYVPDGGEETVEVEGQEPTTQPTYHEGFHVNALDEVPQWWPFEVDPTPNTPWMIFG